MKREANGPALSAIFVDYDNIYLSLKRRNEDAAKRFSKDAGLWLRDLESGALITSTSGFGTVGQRRIVLNRCYGNPVPRRNSHDNSTDMNSFPFIRHHFLRAGAEVVDCPPLTAQLKNSADIRIVMDVRDMITHDTYFDEFIILSSDADFTPLLHRLRAHARRTVIYANDQTASPYTAISDGEVREVDLLRLLLDGRGTDRSIAADAAPAQLPQPIADLSQLRRDLAAEVANLVRAAGQPVLLEALADRLVRQFGHERTSGSGWAQMGGFRDLLASYLPEGLKISEQSPFVVFEVPTPREDHHVLPAAAVPTRQASIPPPAVVPSIEQPARYSAPAGRPAAFPDDGSRFHASPADAGSGRAAQTTPTPAQPYPASHQPGPGGLAQLQPAAAPSQAPPRSRPVPANHEPQSLQAGPAPRSSPQGHPLDRQAIVPASTQATADPARQIPAPRTTALQPGAAAGQSASPQQVGEPSSSESPARSSTTAAAVQQMVARIYDACQAPPLSPPEYRLVFEVMARELTARGLNGTQTLDAISAQAKDHGVDIRRDDVRFILDVVSESDPWFEQGVSPTLFASRFRNFVIARCRSQGLALSADEIDLIDHWFAGADMRAQQQSSPAPRAQHQLPPPGAAPDLGPGAGQRAGSGSVAGASASGGQVRGSAPGQDAWWSTDAGPGQGAASDAVDDFPRIIRSRIRG